MKKFLSIVVAFALVMSILPAQQMKVYAADKAANKKLSQEEAMSKYLVKTANISYRNKNYTVYRVSKQITPKADDYTVIYFDQKGNLVNNKSIYFDLQRLYIMGTCKEPLQTYKNLGGTVIPQMIFGQKAVEIVGQTGVQTIVSGELVATEILKDIGNGMLDFGNASVLWASNEWFNEQGLKNSLDALYETKTGISASMTGNLYIINDNYKYHRFTKVSKMYSNWLNTFFRYASFLNSLDNLGLTVRASSYWDILSKVASIFVGAIVPKLGDVPEFKKEYEEYIGYFLLENVSVTWDSEQGLKLVSEDEELVESLISFFDNLLDYSSSFEDEVDAAFSKQKSSAETCYTIRQTSESAAAVIHSVNPKFVMPPRK